MMRSAGAWRHADLDRLDWLWYVGLPLLSYLLMVGAAAPYLSLE
jgi:hypothetical protein